MKSLYLTHLQLEQPPLLLHLLCDLCSCDLSPDHPVLFGVFSLLLLDLCAEKQTIKSTCGSTPGSGKPDRHVTAELDCVRFSEAREQREILS